MRRMGSVSGVAGLRAAVGTALPWVVAFAVLAGLPAQADDDDDGRRTIGATNLEIRYWPQHEHLALLVRETAESDLKVLARYLNLEIDRTILVEIVRNHREFEQRLGRRAYPWVMGVSKHHQNHVILKPLVGDAMRRLVTHELTHVALDMKMRATRGEPPRWLHEGLAQWMEGDIPAGRKDALGRAIVENRLLTLDELEDAFTGDRATVDLAYAQSYTLVAFMLDTGPPGALGRYLHHLMETGDEMLALQRAMGRPLEAVERSWLEQVRVDYVTRGAPLTMELIIFGMMALILIVAVIVRRRMGREIRERMQEEERLEEIMHGVEVDDEADEPWEEQWDDGDWDDEGWDEDCDEDYWEDEDEDDDRPRPM